MSKLVCLVYKVLELKSAQVHFSLFWYLVVISRDERKWIAALARKRTKGLAFVAHFSLCLGRIILQYFKSFKLYSFISIGLKGLYLMALRKAAGIWSSPSFGFAYHHDMSAFFQIDEVTKLGRLRRLGPFFYTYFRFRANVFLSAFHLVEIWASY